MHDEGSGAIWRAMDGAFRAKGYDELEVYAEEDRSADVTISANVIDAAEVAYSRGFGIRALVKGRVGFAFTSSLEDVLASTERAIENARVSELRMARLPGEASPSKVKWISDDRITELSIESQVALAERIIAEARVAGRHVAITEAGITSSVFSTYIQNSNGLSLYEKGTDISVGAGVIAGKSLGFWAAESRRMDVDVAKVARVASEMAIFGLKKAKLSQGTYDVILSPFAFSEIMDNLFSFWIDADSVQRGESPLAGKLDNAIAPDWLNIVDDAVLDGGLGSALFDREGVRTQTTNIVEKGRLKGYLYDIVSAQKEGKASTGSAQGSFNQLPSVGPSNLVVSADKNSGRIASDLEREAGNCVVIQHIMGGELSNQSTGEFGFPLANAYLVKNGVRTPVKNGMLVGNLFDLLSSMQLIGNDTMQIESVITPSVLVNAMKIVV